MRESYRRLGRATFALLSIAALSAGVNAVSGDVALYAFQDSVTIHTQTNALNVSAAGRIGHRQDGARFSWFADGSNYLRDGSLILGNSSDSLSWLIYEGAGSGPWSGNPFGYLLPLSDIVVDSTTSTLYTKASGIGTNRDSTIGFSVDYYAPKDAANAGFYVARFAVYKGLNDPTGSVTNLTVAFAADWDIPSDIGFENSTYYEDQRQLVWQQGAYAPPNSKRLGGLGILRDDGIGIPGGFVWESAVYVDPLGTYHVDSLWNRMESINGHQLVADTTDLNMVMVVARDLTIDGAANDTFFFSVVIGGVLNGTGANLETVVNTAYYFVCDHIADSSIGCTCQHCGDANNDGVNDISDAVYTLQFIFNNGPAPDPFCLGDMTGDVFVDISDVVAHIMFIFVPGSPPPICHWSYPWWW